MNCRSCGAKNISEFSTFTDRNENKPVTFFLCVGCGSMQNEAIGFKDVDLKDHDLYDDISDSYQMFCMELCQKIFREMPLIRYMTPGKILHIECNDGFFAKNWISRGWNVVGTSISRASRSRTEKKGIECFEFAGMVPCYDFDGVIFETSYSHFRSPFAIFDEGIRRIVPGGFCFIHGIDPSNEEVLNHSTIGQYLGINNRTIPSPNRIIEWMDGRGMKLLDRYHDNGMDLLFIKVGK